MSKDFSSFTAIEHKILSLVQGNLSDSATPFADIASEVGVEVKDVLNLLLELKEMGAIRRFGATLRHQKAGYGFNAMVAWYVEQNQDISQIGEQMASRPEISHCYERKNCLNWPYNLYTMIHGQAKDDCMQVVKELQKQTGVQQYEVFLSIEELKKTSMNYF